MRKIFKRGIYSIFWKDFCMKTETPRRQLSLQLFESECKTVKINTRSTAIGGLNQEKKLFNTVLKKKRSKFNIFFPQNYTVQNFNCRQDKKIIIFINIGWQLQNVHKLYGIKDIQVFHHLKGTCKIFLQIILQLLLSFLCIFKMCSEDLKYVKCQTLNFTLKSEYFHPQLGRKITILKARKSLRMTDILL